MWAVELHTIHAVALQSIAISIARCMCISLCVGLKKTNQQTNEQTNEQTKQQTKQQTNQSNEKQLALVGCGVNASVDEVCDFGGSTSVVPCVEVGE